MLRPAPRPSPEARCRRRRARAGRSAPGTGRRPAADQPTGPVFRLQPVTEVHLGDLLQQPDVVLDVAEHLLPLFPGQRLAGARAALQEPFERLGEGGASRARQVAPRGRGSPLDQGNSPVAGGALRVGGHVLARHLRDDPRPHAQEGADLVERQRRRVDQVPVAQDEDLLPREQPEQPLQLLAIPAEAGVMPERRPARRDPAVFGRARGREVPDGIQPGRPQVRPVGVRPLDRVTQHGDHPGARDQCVDPLLRPAVVQVEGSRLAAQRAGRRGGEQRLVVVPPPDVLPVGLHIAGAAAPWRRAVGEEVLRLLDRGHEQRGMPGQGHMQRGGAGLGGTDRKEIWQGHEGDLLGATRYPTISVNLIG